MRMMKKTLPHLGRSAVALACALACLATHAATINISSRDPAGVGFNDPTPVAPVGGNPGTTLGEQRAYVYRYVADIWEKNLDSNVTITVSAGWEALNCTATSATLGSAGAWNIWHDFPGSKPGTWYPQALANKLAGADLSSGTPDDGSGFGNVDIKTQFNVNLGQPNCLAGSIFYLGLDGKAGNNVNFVETLLHELGHGLGFSALSVQTATGRRLNAAGNFADVGLPSVWEQFMFDNTANKTWLQMTTPERKASALNNLQVAWVGPNVTSSANFLNNVPVIKLSTPAPSGLGPIDYNASPFGATPVAPATLGALAVIATQAGELGPGCSAFDSANTMAVKGKVPVISRGGCGFAVKVKNAQNAGALGVVLANNIAGALVPGGSDPSVTIPSAGVSMADGNALKAAVAAAIPYGTRGRSGSVTLAWGTDTSRIAGADSKGRPLLYTPAVLEPGSSVSHWDKTASPNLLMEPSINPDLGIIMVAPKDLTVPLLKDLGW